jgi:hypothetical protein
VVLFVCSLNIFILFLSRYFIYIVLLGSISSLTTAKMSCSMTIKNGDMQIEVPVVVSSSCQEQLVLEADDIARLELTDIIRQEEVILPDNSNGFINVFSAVTLILVLSDGTTASATVNPCCFSPSSPTAAVEGVPMTMRLIGYNTLMTLRLKPDFQAHKLVRMVGLRI